MTKRDVKEFEICIKGFEFKLERVIFVRVWDSQDFISLPGSTKYAFQGGDISPNPNKKKYISKKYVNYKNNLDS